MHGKRQMFRSSMVVGTLSFLGSLTGILVEASIAARLGLSKSSDTFYAAFTLPYILTNLLKATGQFSLVPFFSSLDAHHSPRDLWRGFSYAVNVLFLAVTAAAALGALVAPWLIRGLAPGFTRPETLVAARLCRWLFLILLPAGITEVIRSFLLSQRRFAVPAAGNFFRNLTVIASIFLTFNRLGFYSIVFGYLAGYLVQLGIFGAQLLASFPLRYSLTLAGSGEAFQRLRGAGAAQVTAALGWQGLVVVERMIASFLPPGTLTALAYGMKIMSTMVEVLAGSVGTAALPTLSRAHALQETEEVRTAIRNAIEIGVVMISPAVVFCLLLPPNVIRLIFERGNFSPQATALTGRVFFFYCLSMIPYATLRILNFYLFSRNEVTIFLRLATLQYALNVALDLLYVGIFHWQAGGIPLGLLTSLAVTCGTAYGRNAAGVKQIVDRALATYFFKIMTGASLAALLVWALRARMAVPQTGLENFVFLVETCGAGTLVFFATLLALRAVRLSQVSSVWQRAGGR
jgi:putative peptidoglycan lipid II flippase